MFDSDWLQHDANTPAKTKVGTPIYMAPEIIMAGQHYDAKVRYPSYSCLLTSMLCLAGPVHTTFKSDNAVKLEPHGMYSRLIGVLVIKTPKQVLHGLCSTSLHCGVRARISSLLLAGWLPA